MVCRILRHFSSGPVLFIRRDIHRSYRSHYETLNLAPTATIQDVKEAYYKLSLKFHPDKPEGNEEKFREITAAYEILGNIKLKRLYDNGLLPGSAASAKPTGTTDRYQEGFKTSDFEHFRRGMSRSDERDRVTIDRTFYDEWTKRHYSGTILRDKKRKAAFMKHQSAMRTGQSEWQFIVLGVLAVIVALLVNALKPNKWDSPNGHPGKKS